MFIYAVSDTPQLDPVARTSEVALNSQIAEVLRNKHPVWRNYLHVEQTGLFPDNPSLRPDILINAPLCQPVVLETEYAPASTVESDAIGRLGLKPTESLSEIEQVFAIRLPLSLRLTQMSFAEQIASARYEYCIFSGTALNPVRFPSDGWLTGDINDIVHCIEFALVSQRLIMEGTEKFEQGINTATRVIDDTVAIGFPDIVKRFARILNQAEGTQTNRMAMTIIANALTFHQSIAGIHDIPSIEELQNDEYRKFKSALIDTWRQIREEINYWPILKIASDLLLPIRLQSAEAALRPLASAAAELAELGITSRHDLAGRMFQNLIIDRKFLATFYTLPTSAALLSEIATSMLRFDWGNLETYPEIRIADLSCGTGTLLSAAYHSVLRRYRRAGGDDKDIHSAMIEKSIYAADIMPAAAHLCASQLSSVHPSVPFRNTQVYTMPYGYADESAPYREVSIGSLDLIESESTASLFSTGQTQLHGDTGVKDAAHVELPHESVDLIIMNPPFTRPTNHKVADVPVPSFAGFRTTHEEQRVMSNRLAKIRKSLVQPAGHGNAGLASNFIDLAHVKSKPGAVMALVLPLAVVRGAAWQSTRDLLSRCYTNVTVISTAKAGSKDRAFSADTALPEALVIATKREKETNEPENATYVNILNRPVTLIEASVIAQLIIQLPPSSKTGQLHLGSNLVGSYIRAPLNQGGCAALRDTSIAATIIAMFSGVLSLPRLRSTLQLPLTKLRELGERGLYDLDIGTWKDQDPPYRGAFQIRTTQGNAAYPMLWAHNTHRERFLLVQPDAEGDVLEGCHERAADLWQTASRLHYSRDFGLNSQSLAACLTQNDALGGRAWPNFKPAIQEWEELLALWANSTLGLMSFWWLGSRQHDGRSILTISRLPELVTIDPRSLEPEKWQLAAEAFKQFQSMPLLPANEAYRDPNRQAIDKFLLIDLLGLPEEILDPIDNLRLRWCSEPSVHGNKHTKPQEQT